MSIDKEKLLDWLNEKYLDENKTHVEARPFNHVMLAIKSGKFDSNQKAITELAVKGLKWYADLENHKWHEDEEDVFKAPWTNVLNDCGSKAKLTLSEIERLSHELDK